MLSSHRENNFALYTYLQGNRVLKLSERFVHVEIPEAEFKDFEPYLHIGKIDSYFSDTFKENGFGNVKKGVVFRNARTRNP